METFERGTTKIAAKGGYSDADKTVIYFVVNRFQVSRMKTIVHEIDPAAYLTITEVADVFKSVVKYAPGKTETPLPEEESLPETQADEQPIL